MNATKRWAYHFVSNLECAKCRTKQNLKLYGYDKKLVDVETLTVEQLKNKLERMDVWCDSCGVVFNTRITGPGRRKRKEEAAYLSDLKVGNDPASYYDQHVVRGRETISKQDFIFNVKSVPCAICLQTFPSVVMDFYHVNSATKTTKVSSMMLANYTLLDVVKEIEKCAIVCSNCYKLLSCGLTTGDNLSTTIINENNFTSVKKK